MGLKVEVILKKKEYEPKHSVRYDAVEKDAPVQSIYLMRTALKDGNKPNTIKITIEGV